MANLSTSVCQAALAVAMGCCCATRSIAVEFETQETRIVEIAEVQDVIRGAARSAWSIRHGINDVEELTSIFVDLEVLRRHPSETVVQQVALALSKADDESAATPLCLMQIQGIENATVVQALSPFVSTKDNGLSKAIAALFDHARPPGRPFDCHMFLTHLSANRRAGGPLPLPLVEYMYSRDPSSAVEVLEKVINADEPRLRSFLLASHVVEDAIWKERNNFPAEARQASPSSQKQLEVLAADTRWWVRLYVCAVLKDMPFLRTPELVAKLLKDENATVRSFACFSRAGSVETDPAGPIEPDAVLQDAFEGIAAGIRGERSDEDFIAGLSKVVRIIEADQVEAVRQLILIHSKATDVDRGMVPAVVIQFANISHGSIVEATVPLLADQTYSRSARRFLGGIVDETLGSDDIADYSRFLEAEAISKYAPLVDQLMYMSPSRAFTAILDAQQIDENGLRWADHVVSDVIWKRRHGFKKEATQGLDEAQRQLRTLTSDQRWWVRLYAAAVLRGEVANGIRPDPSLQTPELVAKLLKDENASVRRFAEALKQ